MRIGWTVIWIFAILPQAATPCWQQRTPSGTFKNDDVCIRRECGERANKIGLQIGTDFKHDLRLADFAGVGRLERIGVLGLRTLMSSSGRPTPCITAATREWIGLIVASTLGEACTPVRAERPKNRAVAAPMRELVCIHV